MKIVGLLSGKGGVGKTCSSVNIAAALHKLGVNTVVVDGNLTTPNVGVYLGSAVVPHTLHHVLQGKSTIHDAVYNHNSGVKFIAGSLALDDMNDLKLNRMKALRDLNTDYVILDGAAGLGGEAIKIMEYADELFIVTNPELPAVTDALKTIKLAEELGKEVKGVIVTRTKNDDLDISVTNIESLLERPVIAVIPEDKTIREALTQKDAIVNTHPRSKAGVAYMRLAASLAGREWNEPPQPSWIERIFGNIWKK